MKIEYLDGYTRESQDIDRACKMLERRAKAAWGDTIAAIRGQHFYGTDPDGTARDIDIKVKKISEDISAAALAYRDLCNAKLAQGEPQPTSAGFPSWVYTRIQRNVAWELYKCSMLIALGRSSGFEEAVTELEDAE